MADDISENLAMRIAGKLGLRRLRWSLRRLHVPVGPSALVLEVGAGGNPYPRSNVLLDGFEASLERQEKSLVKDRPLVLGLCENLPFRDKSFDFVIASHVLEHTDDPDKFLSELQRVAKAGYIETPDAFFERINPFTFHRLEVTEEGGGLAIWKKKGWQVDPELIGLYEKKLKKDAAFQKFIRVFPDPVHMRFYWSGAIKYQVLNPREDASWEYPPQIKSTGGGNSVKEAIRSLYLRFFRRAFSQNRRNAEINVVDLLRCVSCGHGELERRGDSLACKQCGHEYTMREGVPRMLLDDTQGANKIRSATLGNPPGPQ